MGVRDPRALLPPDEPVLHEGRPRGWARPSVGDLVGYGGLAALAVLFLVLGWHAVSSYANASWKLGPWTVQFHGSSPTGNSAGGAGVPSPLALLLLAAFLELCRQAWVRSLRVAVTPRRLLVVQGVLRRRPRSYARTGAERVDPVLGGVAVRALREVRSLFLPGVGAADAEALRGALATFEPAAPAPLQAPAPWITPRRVRAASLVLLVGVAAAAVVRTLQGYRLEVERRATPEGTRIELRVEGPLWTGRNVDVDLLEVAPVGSSALAPQSGKAGATKQGVFRTEHRRWRSFPDVPGPVRVRIAALLTDDARAPSHRPEGAARFEVELSPGETYEAPLHERDGALVPVR